MQGQWEGTHPGVTGVAAGFAKPGTTAKESMLASAWPTSMPLLLRPSWQAARAAALEALRQHPDTHLVQAAVAKAPSGERWWWKCCAQGCHRAGVLQGGCL